MHFKRLELMGFKSFVDHSVLDFETGITAIVGPNGCGKSNVVDSLRWVMGEQNARSLRGAKMEDVIFNGTDQRKALGMAEVTLTIDNQDHLLASENAEVTITRRTYRSGESEYLLNKVPCRLRDIHDLLAGTGLGTNAYSFLEQGKIDLIVSSKPAERRFVFEEAAGISKFKARREESLRKLEATEQNFLRVNDIAAEVKRQIGTLERQAQKARRYQTLKQELTTLEVARGRMDLRERRSALRRLEQDRSERLSALNELEARRSALEGEAQSRAGLEREAEERLAVAQTELNRLAEAVAKAEEYLDSAVLRREDLERNLARARQELEMFAAKAVQIEQDVRAAETARIVQQEERERLQTSLTGEEQALARLEEELKEEALQVQERQQRLLQLVDQLAVQRGVLQNLEEKVREHEARSVVLARRAEVLAGQRAELEQQRSGFETQNQGLQEGIAGLEAQKLALQQELESLARTLETLDAMTANFHKTITQLTSRVNWIQELKNSLDGYDAGAKALLRELREHPERVPGLLGPVANFLRTDAAYELAFEAWLGPKLQYLLVSTTAQAESALRFLAEGGHGRATLIPLDRPAPSPLPVETAPTWSELPGVLGRALDLTRLDERFRRTFETLLGDATLVADREAVRRARAAGATCTLITLAGEVDAPEGWITGGSADLRERGWLGQERELTELDTELQVLQRNLSAAEKETAELQRRREEVAGGLTAGEAEWHDLRIQAAKLDKSLEQINAQITELEAQDAALSAERLAVDVARDQAAADQAATRARLAELEEEDRRTQADLTSQQSKIEARRHACDAHEARIGELRVAAAALDQRCDALSAEVERLNTELASVRSQSAEREATRRGDEARLEDLAAQVREREAQRREWTEALSTQRNEVASWQDRRQELLKTQQASAQAGRMLQHELDHARQSLHQLELERGQLEFNLRSLEEYLQTEYRLNLSLEEEAPAPQAPPPVDGAAGGSLPAADDPAATEARIQDLKEKLSALGTVSLVAMEEYDELQDRFTFLSQQLTDLKESKESLQRLIARINQESRARFQETFLQVRDRFREVFRRLFNGGDAELVLVDENDLLETGIEIIARPPGKRLQNITLLSGGEKALTAIALLFAIYLIKPSPFCIFDEMDAPLDDPNTIRFGRILKEFARHSQFIVITHNKLTMENANVLYGVTMEEPGVSKLVSMRLKEGSPTAVPASSPARPAPAAPQVLAEKAALN